MNKFATRRAGHATGEPEKACPPPPTRARGRSSSGSRVLFLTEEGVTFTLDTGHEYKDIAKNDLGEMALASPAIAGDALYIRTQSKLYKIAR